MVSTDTVVGIVGAALLAVVMVGVFVYEYNNAGDATPIDGNGDGEPDAAALFAARYPLLNATGDLDGDGELNLEDPDIDEDGTNNTADPETVFTTRATQTLGPSLPQGIEAEVYLDITVEAGVEAVTATVTVTSAQPHNLLVQLLGPDDTVLDDQTSQLGTPNSFTLDAGEDPEPGTYRVRVTNNLAGAGASLTTEASADYGEATQPTTPSDIGA